MQCGNNSYSTFLFLSLCFFPIFFYRFARSNATINNKYIFYTI